MKPARPVSGDSDRRVVGGFSLVEVTIAIGIFAFVIVAILGLFPVALRQRSDAALETRAVLVAQQIFEGIRGSTNTSAIRLPPLVLQAKNTNGVRFIASTNLTAFPVLLRYGPKGTTPLSPGAANEWANGSTDSSSDALAQIRIEAVAGAAGLYRATVGYGRPASLPEAKRKNFTFTKLILLP